MKKNPALLSRNKKIWLILLAVFLLGQLWPVFFVNKMLADNVEKMDNLVNLVRYGQEKNTSGFATIGQHSEDEIWWYKLQCALTEPSLVRVELSTQTNNSFTVEEAIYTKDYDDLMLSERDLGKKFNWISGGLINGGILSLPAGTYYHYGNSGVMYVTASDVENIEYDPVERYYRRLRYVLEAKPDIGVMFEGTTQMHQEIRALDIPEKGAVISFGTGGSGFVAANLYLSESEVWKSINGMGPGVFMPDNEQFSYAGNIYSTPLNMVPVPGTPFKAGIHVVMNDRGRVYFKVHYVPDWW